MAEPTERPLKGGNTTPVARLGESVLRESGPWTATVQKLLTHLRAAGITWCPEPQGWTTDGRESLTYLKGKVPADPMPDWVYSDEVLVGAASWLRQLHDATVGFDEPARVWRAARHEPVEVVCHNDFAPYNFVFREHQLVGVIDWDFASPGPRLWDLSYLAYRLVPLMGPDNPNSPSMPLDLMGRLRTLRDSYGSTASTQEILTMVVTRLEDLADFTRGQAKRTKNPEFLEHVRGYEADADFLRSLVGRQPTG